MITELNTLAKAARVHLPLVEELAADIFMGSFSAKFVAAAKLAAELLKGSLYERYYAIDYDVISSIDDLAERAPGGARTSDTFDALCRARAGVEAIGYDVATNGKVIEQSQILTTHNLAALTGPFGVGEEMKLDPVRLTHRCFDEAMVLAARLLNNPRPLRTVKDLAYAWRQMILFLGRAGEAEAATAVQDARERLARRPAHVVRRMQLALAGLEYVLAGGSFDEAGRGGGGRRLLGWTTDRHWILQAE